MIYLCFYTVKLATVYVMSCSGCFSVIKDIINEMALRHPTIVAFLHYVPQYSMYIGMYFSMILPLVAFKIYIHAKLKKNSSFCIVISFQLYFGSYVINEKSKGIKKEVSYIYIYNTILYCPFTSYRAWV